MTRRLMNFYGAATVLMAWPWIRVRVVNRSGIVPGQPCLFISNHQSFADPYLMGFFPNEFVFISNRWPFHIPLLGFFAKLAGYLNAQQLNPEVFFAEAKKHLDDGVTLFSFAEGTRTRTGELGAFHTTAFRLALAMKVPIVPVCIAGAYRIFPTGNTLLRPGVAHVHALPNIPPQEFEHLTAHQLKQKVRQIIASQIAVLEGGIACH